VKHSDLIPRYFRFTEELRRGIPPNTLEMDALADAHSELERIVCEEPIADSWQLVREVLQRAPDTELELYAVGLLELFVSARREGSISPIEREAAIDERFKWALGRIYLDSDLPEDSVRRLHIASGHVIT
jgi:hypothetical protein